MAVRRNSPWDSWRADPTTELLLFRHNVMQIDFAVHTAADLDWVAQELNDRPRKRAWATTSRSRTA